MSIRQYLKTILGDAEITNLTANKKVYFLHADEEVKTPYIEYEVIDEQGEEWAENKEIATTYYVQVDIFSKTNYSKIEEKIKEKLINAGFERSMAADLYEKDTELYHKALRFSITSMEV